MTGDERRQRYHVLANTWARDGDAAFVSKLGSGGRSCWIVTVQGIDTPTVFRTKREALAHARARVAAELERFEQSWCRNCYADLPTGDWFRFRHGGFWYCDGCAP